MAYLSKSKYIHGLQCPKLLWYEYNRKKEIPPPGPAVQRAFDEGHKVGEYAHRLFPDGIVVKRDWDPIKQNKKSLDALKLRKPLFEAGFVFKNTYALADILVPVEEDHWDLVEVKSSTSVKEENCHDAAFQTYTYEGAGLKIRNVYIMYINKEYVRQGEIDPQQLFIKADITKESSILKIKIASAVELLQKIMAQKDMPDIKIGTQCGSPHACPLQDICWDFLPKKDSIFVLYAGGKRRFDLLDQGIDKIVDIPDDHKLNYKQVLQIEAHRKGEPYVDKEALKEFLDGLEYPLYFLDFETIALALPPYDRSSPYENIPFQYSLHVVKKPGAKPVRHHYIAPGNDDPREEILRQLKKILGDKGSIIAYSASYEKGCIKKASHVYTEYKQWSEDLMGRFVDLLEPFKNFYYYHPAQGGSASLKYVLPALTQSSYEDMTIADGGVASAEYARITFAKDVGDKEKQEIRSALEKYCDLDTLGMVQIVDALKALL
jgi:hypothetical protein